MRLEESADGNLKWTVIPATLSVVDCVNGNKRRYSRQVWEKNLEEGSLLQESIKRRSAFGLLEHPSDGHVDLNSPIAVLTTKAVLSETQKGEIVVEGEILVLSTPEGRRLCSLIEAGYDPTVSSRGFGTLVKAGDGIDEVQDDYVCEGWDVVMTPSFTEAKTRPARESVEPPPAVAATPPVTETVTPPVAKPAPISEQQHDPKVVSQPQPTHETTMDITQIRESLATLRATDPSKLEPVAFAQGMSHMHDLHNQVAAFVAEDAKRAWDGQKIHESLSGLETQWVEAITAPSKEVKSLKETQTKILQAFKQVTALAARYKKGLGEAIKQIDHQKKVTEKLAQRGRSWMAESAKQKKTAEGLDKRLDFTCEAIAHMRGRYHTDMAHLGRRTLTLEFKDLSDEEKKVVTEAKTPKAVVAARKAIEEKRGIKPKKGVRVQEGKSAPAATAPKTDDPAAPAVVEAKTDQPGITIVRRPDAVSVTESIALTKRLSTAGGHR